MKRNRLVSSCLRYFSNTLSGSVDTLLGTINTLLGSIDVNFGKYRCQLWEVLIHFWEVSLHFWEVVRPLPFVRSVGKSSPPKLLRMCLRMPCARIAQRVGDK